MALLYICDYCGTKYTADIAETLTKQTFGGNDNDFLIYNDGTKRLRTRKPTDPCQRCGEAADKARQEALDKRKAENTPKYNG